MSDGLDSRSCEGCRMSDGDFFAEARRSFHTTLFRAVLRSDAQCIPSNADKHGGRSVKIASGIFALLGAESTDSKPYAVAGEFARNRLDKVLTNTKPVQRHAALSAAVHFGPQLTSYGLSENRRLHHLRSLEWLVAKQQIGEKKWPTP